MWLSLLAKHRMKNFLWKIVTGNEKYIFFANPKRKNSWVDPGQPSTSNPQQKIHMTKKVFLCIYWDMKDVLYEFLETGQTITTEHYSQQLNKLNEVVDEKRPLVG